MSIDKTLKQKYQQRVAEVAKDKGVPESLVRAGWPFEVFLLEEQRDEWYKTTAKGEEADG